MEEDSSTPLRILYQHPDRWTYKDVETHLFMAMGLYESFPTQIQTWIREEYESRKLQITLDKSPEPELPQTYRYSKRSL